MKTGKWIEHIKNSLIKKAKTKGLYENFGDKEIRALRDKFDYFDLQYGTEQERREAKMIDDFAEWCMDYTGN